MTLRPAVEERKRSEKHRQHWGTHGDLGRLGYSRVIWRLRVDNGTLGDTRRFRDRNAGQGRIRSRHFMRLRFKRETGRRGVAGKLFRMGRDMRLCRRSIDGTQVETSKSSRLGNGTIVLMLVVLDDLLEVLEYLKVVFARRKGGLRWRRRGRHERRHRLLVGDRSRKELRVSRLIGGTRGKVEAREEGGREREGAVLDGGRGGNRRREGGRHDSG